MKAAMAAPALVAALLVALSPWGAAALSWPVCENGGSVFATERPRLMAFPGANVWLFCSAPQVLGFSLGACFRDVCGAPAADAYCKMLGFDAAAAAVVEGARPGEPVAAIDGRFCVAEGVYADEAPPPPRGAAAPAAAAGPPCKVVREIQCVRRLETMRAQLQALGVIGAAAPAPEDEAAAAAGAPPAPVRVAILEQPAPPGGRKRL